MARSFQVDYESNTFLMDGKPFRYVSGSFHYFRAHPDSWRRKLKTMRAAGLNAVDTYVEWSLHNPKDGVYDFEGIANIEKFIELATDEGFYVILRPGPYICAERDNGGLPHWLFTKYSDIKMRTSDANYKKEVSIWYSKLMPKLQKYFYENGGPIIMIENEYGAFSACDKDYLNWLRDETQLYVKNKALLFTKDIPDEKISCGKIENVFATTDFGAERVSEIDELWKTLRSVQPSGPLVNSEFYPGWLTHWQEENQRRNSDDIAEALRKILEYGASVNFYMFFGGTNFGFTAGANDFGSGKYVPDITSYDYDAVMDEAGDPTEKYVKVRNVIKDFLPLPANLSIPVKEPKMALNPIKLNPIANLLDDDSLRELAVKTENSNRPKTFEDLNQFSGLVLYVNELPNLEIDPSSLTVNDLRDRGLIYIDGHFVGILSRENVIKSIPISASYGKKLQILVENQGRINFHVADDTKGILGDVSIQRLGRNTTILENWTSISIPLESEQILKLVQKKKKKNNVDILANGLLLQGPVIFYSQFNIEKDVLYDTYLDTSKWGKGVVYINGFNLGRYWPLAGPQKTLYVPREILHKHNNELVVVEYQKSAKNFQIEFLSNAILDG